MKICLGVLKDFFRRTASMSERNVDLGYEGIPRLGGVLLRAEAVSNRRLN